MSSSLTSLARFYASRPSLISSASSLTLSPISASSFWADRGFCRGTHTHTHTHTHTPILLCPTISLECPSLSSSPNFYFFSFRLTLAPPPPGRRPSLTPPGDRLGTLHEHALSLQEITTDLHLSPPSPKRVPQLAQILHTTSSSGWTQHQSTRSLLAQKNEKSRLTDLPVYPCS